jgi:hypothetical protein
MRTSSFVITWAIVVAACAYQPCAARADRGESILGYSLNGLWTGAKIGLAAGYLSTGERWESREWRNLAFGAGVGVIAGTGIGLMLGIVDASSDPPPTGWYALRDCGYGVLVGALVGAAVGALMAIDDGRPKDILIGGSYGVLIGAAAGIAFGIFEGATDDAHDDDSDATAALSLVITPVLGAELPQVGLRGRY